MDLQLSCPDVFGIFLIFFNVFEGSQHLPKDHVCSSIGLVFGPVKILKAVDGGACYSSVTNSLPNYTTFLVPNKK